MAKHEDALRCMALGDERYVKDVLAMQLSNVDASGLDPKTHALVRLGALIALDASQSSFQWNAATALASGATVDEIVGVLIAVAQTVGLARVSSAAPAVALRSGTTSTRRWRPTTRVDGPSAWNTGSRQRSRNSPNEEETPSMVTAPRDATSCRSPTNREPV